MSQRKRLSKAARRRRQRNRRIAMFIVGLLIVGAVWFGILLFLNGRKEDSAREPITSGQENEPGSYRNACADRNTDTDTGTASGCGYEQY